MKNTLGVQLREGFNKWAKAGITLFAAHEYKNFKLPSALTTDSLDVFDIYKEHHISVGGEIAKTEGHTFHYRVGAEFWAIGPMAGDLEVTGKADLNFRLGRDTVRLEANAFFKNISPAFYFTHFHSQPHFWDLDLGKETTSPAYSHPTTPTTGPPSPPTATTSPCASSQAVSRSSVPPCART